MAFHEIDKPSEDRLRMLYLDQELSMRQIGILLGISDSTVKYYIDKYNIPRRSQSESMHARSRTQGLRRDFPKGENSHSWKGGRRLSTNGYVQIHQPDHKRSLRNGYVFEHIIVWEKHYGEVPCGYHIHHKNGVKDDNRIENLEVISPSAHALVIPNMERKIYELENLVIELKKEIEELKRHEAAPA